MPPTLTTHYLGFKLRNPLIAGASPRTTSPDSALALEDAGIGAIVMRSIFEEQIRNEVAGLYEALSSDLRPEAQDYLRADLPMQLGPESYLKTVETLRNTLSIPVIASINCTSADTWVRFARKLESAGAQALELNIYDVPVQPETDGAEIEARHVALVASVVREVRIPVAVKLSPFYSSVLNLAGKIDANGAAGLVLFNRFLQPDIDIETLQLVYEPNLSRSEDLRLPLRWVAILRDRIRGNLSLTGGVHSGADLIKAILAGADTVQICSRLYQPDDTQCIGAMLKTLSRWMTARGFDSLEAFRGHLREQNLQDRSGFERAHYIRTLSGQRE